MAQELSKKCGVCTNHVAQLFCYDCKYYLCKNCHEWHDRFPPTSRHTVTDVHDIDQLALQDKLSCEKHKEDFVYFCECECLICSTCVVTDHTDHSCKKISTVVQDVRSSVQKTIEDVKEKMNLACDLIKEMENEKFKQVQNSTELFSKEVHALSEDIVGINKSTCDKYSNRASDFLSIEKQQMQFQIAKLEKFREDYSILCGKLENILSLKYDVAFYLNLKLVEKEMIERENIPSLIELEAIEKFNIDEFLKTFIEQILEKYHLTSLQERDDAITSLEQNFFNEQKKSAEVRKEIETCESQIHQLQTNLESGNKSLQEREDAITSLEQKLLNERKKSAEVRKEIETCESQIHQLQTNLESCNKSLQEKDAIITSLQQKLLDYQAQVVEIGKESESKLNQLQAQLESDNRLSLDTKNGEISRLEKQFEERESKLVKELELLKRNTDFTFILIGGSGAGKSSTGNTILGKEKFLVRFDNSPVTKQIQKASCLCNGYCIEVVDTPGFNVWKSTRAYFKQIEEELANINSSEVFFLLVMGMGRSNHDLNENCDVFRKLRSFNRNTIVLFTCNSNFKGISYDLAHELYRMPRYKIIKDKRLNEEERLDQAKHFIDEVLRIKIEIKERKTNPNKAKKLVFMAH